MNELFRKLQDGDLLGLLMYGEARGEGLLGQVAVGCVVRNRVRKSGKPYSDVILQPYQFSCFNTNDPNRSILEKIAQAIVDGKDPQETSGIFQQCRWLAYGVINKSILDVTFGATHYFANTINKPSWANNMIETIRIGGHIFLKEKV